MPAALAQAIETPFLTTTMTCANGNNISGGQLLVMVDPNTASGASNANWALYPAAGIAAHEKKVGDGSTTISIHKDGIFDITASGAIAIGQPVRFAPENYVKAILVAELNLTMSGAWIAGYAMETATDGEVIQVRLKL